MKLKEVQQDLFSLGNEYYLVYCVSNDFMLGAGIAKEFERRFNLRVELYKINHNKPFSNGYCCLVGRVFNLVTKDKFYQKPTYETLRVSLEDLKKQVIALDIKKIGMPLIGCGLDRLNWNIVKRLITNVFQTIDIEIVVCRI